jgi:predicted kinase
MILLPIGLIVSDFTRPIKQLAQPFTQNLQNKVLYLYAKISDSPMKAFVLIGAPGAGKSTLARKLAKECGAAIVCGDQIRQELYGDMETHGNWTEIHDRIVERLEQNISRNVILDGTHFSSSYRVGALLTLKTYGWDNVIACVVHPPLEQCLIQNSLRSRVMPRNTITSMWKKLQSSLSDLPQEGFSEIVYY